MHSMPTLKYKTRTQIPTDQQMVGQKLCVLCVRACMCVSMCQCAHDMQDDNSNLHRCCCWLHFHLLHLYFCPILCVDYADKLFQDCLIVLMTQFPSVHCAQLRPTSSQHNYEKQYTIVCCRREKVTKTTIVMYTYKFNRYYICRYTFYHHQGTIGRHNIFHSIT